MEVRKAYNKHILHHYPQPNSKKKPLSPKDNLTQSFEPVFSGSRKLKAPVNETYQHPPLFASTTYDDTGPSLLHPTKAESRSGSQTGKFVRPEHIKSLHSTVEERIKPPTSMLSPKEESLTQYQDEIKETIEKMLKVNGYPALPLKKTHRNQYVVSLEDLALVLATVISDVDKKDKRIAELQHDTKKMDKKITELEGKLRVNCKELELRCAQLKELQQRQNEAFDRVKELEKIKQNMYNDKIVKSFSSTLPSPTTHSTRSHEGILEEVQKLVKAKTPSELPQAIKKMTQVLRAVPQMEHFIKSISSLVQQDSGPTKRLDEVLPTLRQWADEREECRRILFLRQKLCQTLYEEGAEIRDIEELINIATKTTR